MNRLNQLGLLATTALALASCTSGGGKSPSGFLTNYKQMDAGYGTADAISSYVKPGASLKKYDRVIIEPVTTVVAATGISPAVTNQVAAYLSDALHSQLGSEMKIVSVAGPTTLRVRAALTDVIEDRSAGHAVTTVQTGARAKLSGNLGSAAVANFVSNVSFEGEILDSVSGERLYALSDHRLASKRAATPTTPWTSIRDNVNQRAARLNARVKELRAR